VPVFAPIATAGSAGLVHHDLRQSRQRRRELAPDPARQVLAGRVLEPRHFVQIAMIEPFVQRRERLRQLAEVPDPAGLAPDRPAHPYLDAKRMAVQPPALVPGGHVRQIMGRLDAEYLEYLHDASNLSGGLV